MAIYQRKQDRIVTEVTAPVLELPHWQLNLRCEGVDANTGCRIHIPMDFIPSKYEYVNIKLTSHVQSIRVLETGDNAVGLDICLEFERGMPRTSFDSGSNYTNVCLMGRTLNEDETTYFHAAGAITIYNPSGADVRYFLRHTNDHVGPEVGDSDHIVSLFELFPSAYA